MKTSNTKQRTQFFSAISAILFLVFCLGFVNVKAQVNEFIDAETATINPTNFDLTANVKTYIPMLRELPCSAWVSTSLPFKGSKCIRVEAPPYTEPTSNLVKIFWNLNTLRTSNYLDFRETRYYGFAMKSSCFEEGSNDLIFQSWQGSPLWPPFSISRIGSKLNFTVCNDNTRGRGTRIPLTPEAGSISIPASPTNWNRIVIMLKPCHVNMPGTGQLKIWVNGVLASDWTGYIGYDPAGYGYPGGTRHPNGILMSFFGIYSSEFNKVRTYDFDNISDALTFDEANNPLKDNQTISFAPIPNHEISDADFAPSASASSGLVVSLSSSNTNVATILNGRIHLVGVGTTTITANQGGNLIYFKASSVSKTLTVTCTETSIKPYYQVNNDLLQNSKTVSCVIGDNIILRPQTANNGTWRWTGPAGFSASTREVTITSVSTLKAGNYTASFINSCGTVSECIFSITLKKTQTITFPDIPTKLTTDTDFIPNASASSGLAITYTSDNASVATIKNGKIHLVAAGIALITATQAGNSQFAPAFSVTKPVTVKNPITTSIQTYETDLFADQATCSPNPFHDQSEIRAKGDFSYEIIDIAGNKLEEGSGSNSVSIGTALIQGIYIMKIKGKVTNQVLKISKQ